MNDTSAEAASLKKKSTARKTPTATTHPPVTQMVNAALTALNNNKGTSLQAIKTYIIETYTVDMDKLARHVRNYLKTAVTNKTIIQTKGAGAYGSFKLAKAAKKLLKEKKATAVKKIAPTKVEVIEHVKEESATEQPI